MQNDEPDQFFPVPDIPIQIRARYLGALRNIFKASVLDALLAKHLDCRSGNTIYGSGHEFWPIQGM
jgi:hypothetical protein